MDQNASLVRKGSSTDVTGYSQQQLYTWGLGKSGQLATGKQVTEHSPHMIKLPANLDGRLSVVKQVACGGLYTAVLTETGDVFTAGCGKYGRLGTGNEENQTNLVKSSLPEKVIQIACGSWHGAAVTVSHGLVVWGHRKGCGDMPANLAINASHSSTILTQPTLLLTTTSYRVAGVACGHNFTIAWLHDGQALSWGSGHHGVLGQGHKDDVSAPTLVEALKDEMIVEASAGYSHSGFVTNSGHVYMCGKGADGALGLGENLKDVTRPQKVVFPEETLVVKVSCSVGEHHGHTLALTREGRVCSWGDGYKGKLGLGNLERQLTPAIIPESFFDLEHVIVICCGGIHSTAATAEGHIYTWGCGSDGRLGHPEGLGHRYLYRSDTPKKVERLVANNRAATISCSYYHCAAIV